MTYQLPVIQNWHSSSQDEWSVVHYWTLNCTIRNITLIICEISSNIYNVKCMERCFWNCWMDIFQIDYHLANTALNCDLKAHMLGFEFLDSWSCASDTCFLAVVMLDILLFTGFSQKSSGLYLFSKTLEFSFLHWNVWMVMTLVLWMSGLTKSSIVLLEMASTFTWQSFFKQYSISVTKQHTCISTHSDWADYQDWFARLLICYLWIDRWISPQQLNLSPSCLSDHLGASL